MEARRVEDEQHQTHPAPKESSYEPGLVARDVALCCKRRACNYLLCGLCPSLWEARGVWRLFPRLPNFVQGLEGAHYDCGLIVSGKEGPFLSPDLSARFADAEDFCARAERQKLVVGLDFKMIGEKHERAWMGPWCFFGFRVSDKQRGCAAFIVSNSAAPHLVALVPEWYISWYRKPGGYIYCSGLIPLHKTDLEPFPMELTPFVMPGHFLASAIKSLDEFCRGQKSIWENPYNRIAFEGCPVPPLHDMSVMHPPPGSSLTDHDTIEGLRRCFQASQTYKIELPNVRAAGGDFIIRHVHGERIWVELKRSCATISASGVLRHPNGFSSGSDQSWRPTFSGESGWDFLLSTMPLRGQALFVSRDDLPDEWFESAAAEPDQTLSWDPKASPLQQHLIKWDKSNLSASVGEIENILNQRQHAGLSARKIRPFTVPAPGQWLHRMDSLSEENEDFEEASEETEDSGSPHHPADCDEILPGGDEPDRAFRGTTTRWSRKNYGYKQALIFKDLCRKESYGALYYLGPHPVAPYAFYGASWGGDRPPSSLFSLPLDARLMFVDFLPVGDLDDTYIHDKRRPTIFRGVTHPQHPLVYILNPWREGPACSGLNLKQYVVPSEEIVPEPQRRQMIDKLEAATTWSFVSRHALGITFRSTELVDTFEVREDDLVGRLRRLFEKEAPNLYLTTRRDMMRGYLKVLLHETHVREFFREKRTTVKKKDKGKGKGKGKATS